MQRLLKEIWIAIVAVGAGPVLRHLACSNIQTAAFISLQESERKEFSSKLERIRRCIIFLILNDFKTSCANRTKCKTGVSHTLAVNSTFKVFS